MHQVAVKICLSILFFSITSANATEQINGQRTDIVDRNGIVLATNVKTAALYAFPQELVDPKNTVERLVQIFQGLDAKQLMTYIMERTSYDLTDFFNQYLHNEKLPEFQYKLVKEGRNTTLIYRWEAIKKFDMPLLVNTVGKDFWIYPNSEWKEMSLGKIDSREFSVKEELFLLDIKKVK